MKILNQVLIRMLPCEAPLSGAHAGGARKVPVLGAAGRVHGPARRTGAGLEIEVTT